jgi:hypothetical protein
VGKRIAMWFGFVLLASLLPLGLLALKLVFSHQPVSSMALLGRGDLFLIGAVLTAGGAGELFLGGAKGAWHVLFGAFSLLASAGNAAAYAASQEFDPLVLTLSWWFIGVSLVFAFVSVALAAAK